MRIDPREGHTPSDLTIEVLDPRVVSTTGIAGLTLGGGFGYLTRQFGWSCDNVVSMDLVTADGRVVRASEDAANDLFWGLRGGGGNFGVVTSLEYKLHPVGPEVIGGAIALVVCHTSPVADAQKELARIKAFGSPLGDVVQLRSSYVSQQSLIDGTQPKGRRYYWKSEFLPRLDPGLLAMCIEHSERIVSPHSAIVLFPLEGALNRLPTDHSAVGNRSASWVLNITASWEEAGQDDANIQWARAAWGGHALLLHWRHLCQLPDGGGGRRADTRRPWRQLRAAR